MADEARTVGLGSWGLGLGLFNVGQGGIYNEFKLLFLVGGVRALTLKHCLFHQHI